MVAHLASVAPLVFASNSEDSPKLWLEDPPSAEGEMDWVRKGVSWLASQPPRGVLADDPIGRGDTAKVLAASALQPSRSIAALHRVGQFPPDKSASRQLLCEAFRVVRTSGVVALSFRVQTVHPWDIEDLVMASSDGAVTLKNLEFADVQTNDSAGPSRWSTMVFQRLDDDL